MRRALLALCLAAGGCTNNPYPPGESGESVLYRVLADDPKTFDPSVAYSSDQAIVIDNIYASYFQYNFLKRDPVVLELCLGAEEPRRERLAAAAAPTSGTVQADGERWTFRIKPGLRFQDDPCFAGGKGREIKAADFLFSFRRMADPAVACPVLAFFQDKIVGFDAYVEHNRERATRKLAADYDAPVEGLQLDPADPYTFRIAFKQPYPQLRYLMAMHFTTPLAREAVETYGKELARHPVGCGAYLLAEYKRKQRIVLRANPNRRPEFFPSAGMPDDAAQGRLADAGKQLPLTQTIVYNIVREGITSWNLFLQGYEDSAGVTQTNFQQVLSRPGQLSDEMKRRGVQLFRAVSPNLYYFAFNMEDPVFGGYTPQKRKLRQAVSLAIDSQAFIDLFSQGLGASAEFIIPPGVFGHEPGYRNPYRQHDLGRAKQLLTEAGYPGGKDPATGKPLAIYFDNTGTTPASRQLVGLVVKQLEALGLKVESKVLRYEVWLDKVDKGEFQFITFGWLADYPDPENFTFLLYGPNKGPGPNASRYDSPEYNRLFEQMRALDDGPERLALIRKLRDVAVEDCPWIYLNHDESLAIAHRWVKNLKAHPVAMDTGRYLRVDPAERVRCQREWNRPNYWPALAGVVLLIAGSIPAARVVSQRRNRHVRRTKGAA